MGRRRGFLPPPHCQQCGKEPNLGLTLWPGDKWRCIACLKDSLPGRDCISKSMHQMTEHEQAMREAFDLEADGSNADEPRNRAEWARIIAAEIRKQGMALSKEFLQGSGEAVPPRAERFLHDTLTVPDLAAVEASFNRSRLLLENGTDVAAMALDAASSIQASNSLEKMLAHQLAAAHKEVMQQLGRVKYDYASAAEAKRLNAAARCMTAYQHGLLTLAKLRQNGNQRITVQYVNVSNGSQAVLGDIVKQGQQG